MLVNMNTLKTVINGLLMKINSKADKKDVVQSDWNQNDETASDYIKNRPFYEKKNVFFDNTVKLDKYGDVVFQLLKPMPAQEPFFLVIEDTTWEINLKQWETDYGSNILDANGEIIGNISTDDLSSVTTLMYISLDDSQKNKDIYVSLYQQGEIKKIDSKYLPDNIGIQPDWNQNDENAPGYIKNRPFYAEKNVFFDDTVVDFDEYGNCYLQLLKPMPTNEDFSLTIGDITQTISLEYQETDYGSNILDAHGEVIGYIYTNIADTVTSVIIYFFDLVYEDGVHISLYSLSNIKKIDSEYIPSDLNKLDKINPSGTGSFSINRMPYSDIGEYSHAEGEFNVASGRCSHAEGAYTAAHHRSTHVQGEYNLEDNQNGEVYKIQTNVSFGGATAVTYSNSYFIDEVNRTINLSEPLTSCFINEITKRPAYFWYNNKFYCMEEGKSYSQIDQLGVIWADSTRGKYAHIVGNGENDANRSNAHTLDWEGNAWYSGDVYVGSTSGTNYDEGSKKLATEKYIIDKFNSTEVGSLNIDGITDKNRIGSLSYILGDNCEAGSVNQFVHGTYNIPEGKYTEAINEAEERFPIKKYSYYITSDEYTFDENTGLFSLKNPQKEYVSSSPKWMGKYILPNHEFSYDKLISNQARYLYYIFNNAASASSGGYNVRAIKHYAIADDKFKSNYLHIIGNGNNNNHNYFPSNAHTLDREGNAWYAGDIYVGSTSGTNKDEGSKKLATEEYVSTAISSIPPSGAQVQIITWEADD